MTSNIVAHPIVVGVDGSASSMHAARWAAEEASRRRLVLRLVHAVNASPLAYTSGLGSPESFAEFFEALESDGRRHLVDAETAVRRAHPDLKIDTDLQSADPVPTLITESGHARMIVLGSRDWAVSPASWSAPPPLPWPGMAIVPSRCSAGARPGRSRLPKDRWWSEWTAPRPATRHWRWPSTRPRGGVRSWWPCIPGSSSPPTTPTPRLASSSWTGTPSEPASGNCWRSGWPAGRRSTRTSRCAAWSPGTGRCAARSSTPPMPNYWWSGAAAVAGLPGCCWVRRVRR